MKSTFNFAAALFAAVLVIHGGAVQAADPAGCGSNGVLDVPTTPGIDLVISTPCRVETTGIYQFGDVFVVDGGTLEFTDVLVDFWASNILIENGGTLTAGTQAAPIGTAGGKVTIHLWGKDASNGDPTVKGIGVVCRSDSKGHCGVPDEIWDSNVHDMNGMPMPVPPADAVKICTLSSGSTYPPAVEAGGYKACPAGTSWDPAQIAQDYFYAYNPLQFDDGKNATGNQGYFGYKVLGVSYGGSLKLHGLKGGIYSSSLCKPAPTSSGRSWARLDKVAMEKSSSLTVDREMTLKAGDQIVVTSTDYLPGHSEQVTVKDDVSCGKVITLTKPLTYTHNGTRYPLTEVPPRIGLDAQLQDGGAETRAAVGVLTRSIRIVSGGDTLGSEFPEAPTWTPASAPGYYFGGHMIARQGFKAVQIQGVEFYEMGQGGKIGHYPVHFHHARRTAPDTYVRDSSINDSMTRWIVLHGTQDVKLERNVGYKSIGHGFYLEDGTEINNTLTANLGVFARAAVSNIQNPRQVPGILVAPDVVQRVDEAPAYRSDFDHPTIFWIMNTWNTFQDNLAVGAGTCGVCYWMLPAFNSGMSRDMRWASYASMQSNLDRAGMTPLKSFVGNGCSAAMTAFQTIGKTESCKGIALTQEPDGFPVMKPVVNSLAPPSLPPAGSDAEQVAAAVAAAAAYYPMLDGGGGRFGTLCTAEDCSVTPQRCSAGDETNCQVAVLDHFTTSFNWAAFNFAAIWLRPQWYLVTDSVITDSQGAGLTIVTGGGYSESDVIPGHWALVRKSVFIGNTQDCPTCAIKTNPYASNGGPFNPKGLLCDMRADKNRPGNYCLSTTEGVSFQMSNFGMYQRLFSVYDGPAFQDSNAYLNIRKRTLDDCDPFIDGGNVVGQCRPKPGGYQQSRWIVGNVNGLPKQTPADGGPSSCYMPNAAIGWKQPNGFYYPPAFHSLNLFFGDDVDIRHFVVSPLFKEGTYTPDIGAVTNAYCVYNKTLFNGFAGNDRQTVLNDDDGSLTGYKDTTVINLDSFFAAPVDALQCRSDKSSRTSPYEYVTTVVYPQCVYDGTCALPPVKDPPNPNWNSGDWNRSCTSELCYGVPLWRQDDMPDADGKVAKSIRMMGQETSQRSSLTVNHGTYYMDTTVGLQKQLECTKEANETCVVNVFKPNETYYMFLIFAKETTEQTYRFYVGDATFDPASIRMIQAPIGKNPIQFDDTLGPLPPGRAKWLNGSSSGVVEVTLKLTDLPGLMKKIADADRKKCQPASYCTWNPAALKGMGQCEGVTATGKPNGDANVCRWAIADQDCPDGGCFGIKFTLPPGFATDPQKDPRPAAKCVEDAAPWNVHFLSYVDPDKGKAPVCPVAADKFKRDFCGPKDPALTGHKPPRASVPVMLR